MPSKSVQHQAAWSISRNILGIFEPLLRPEEAHLAFSEVYEAVTRGLEEFERQLDRLRHRLAPEGDRCK